mmetsp:Transcript_30213/g.80894  ORF Transcript_30213/g.80894 Transcript_30213/m.80894 type:complete len:210 (-) Transcript_30213:39-668(-)
MICTCPRISSPSVNIARRICRCVSSSLHRLSTSTVSLPNSRVPPSASATLSRMSLTGMPCLSRHISASLQYLLEMIAFGELWFSSSSFHCLTFSSTWKSRRQSSMSRNILSARATSPSRARRKRSSVWGCLHSGSSLHAGCPARSCTRSWSVRSARHSSESMLSMTICHSRSMLMSTPGMPLKLARTRWFPRHRVSGEFRLGEAPLGDE